MLRFLVAIMLSFGSSSVCGATARSVDVTRLVANPRAFLDTLVSFHACLINASPHGEFISPCGHLDWQSIVIVSAADFDDPFLAPGKRFKLRCARGKFTGVVVATTLAWPSKREAITIHLKSVSSLSQCKA